MQSSFVSLHILGVEITPVRAAPSVAVTLKLMPVAMPTAPFAAASLGQIRGKVKPDRSDPPPAP